MSRQMSTVFDLKRFADDRSRDHFAKVTRVSREKAEQITLANEKAGIRDDPRYGAQAELARAREAEQLTLASAEFVGHTARIRYDGEAKVHMVELLASNCGMFEPTDLAFEDAREARMELQAAGFSISS